MYHPVCVLRSERACALPVHPRKDLPVCRCKQVHCRTCVDDVHAVQAELAHDEGGIEKGGRLLKQKGKVKRLRDGSHEGPEMNIGTDGSGRRSECRSNASVGEGEKLMMAMKKMDDAG
jgi:hypothetical protein